MNKQTNQFSDGLKQQQTLEQDLILKVSELDKEAAMEDALSHTTRYNPFESNQEADYTIKSTNSKIGIIVIAILFVVMILFIFLLPQISKLFGW